ncbi:Serine/threonine-protein kinase pelle, partial [Armadillidium nasatum]
MISYKELEEATSSWSRNQLLGSGGFGSVYKGTWINVNVAIKKINQIQKELPNSSSMHMSQVLDELRFLQKYRHDNILQVYGFSADPDKPHCLVYQFMSNGSLEYRLQCKKIEAFSESVPSPLTWPQRFNIAKGTAAALQFLHTVQEKPLIHGDVKSANILLDGYLQPKLGDFGLAREGPHSEYTSMKVSHVHGTRPYIPEEYLRSKKLSTKVDTYSFGIVLFEISSGKRAYNDKTKKYLKEEVLETTDPSMPRPVTMLLQVFDNLYLIGMRCIHRVPKKRPDMTTVFQDLESFGNFLKEEERNRKISIEEYSHALSSQTPPLTFNSISTSPSIYRHHPSMHAPHPFMHGQRMMNPHLHSFSPSPQLPYRNHPVVPGMHSISPVSHGIPLWMKGIPVPQQEIRTFSPEPGRPSQGFCPSPQPALQKGREENVQIIPPQIPMIPDISRLILQSSSEMPVEQMSSDNSSASSSSDSSEEESELQMDMSGSHESLPAANSNNNAASSPKDSKERKQKSSYRSVHPIVNSVGNCFSSSSGK